MGARKSGFLSAGALLLLVTFSRAVAAQNRPAPPVGESKDVVTAIEVKFHTNDDDKDQDTKLVTSFQCGDAVFASSETNHNVQSPDAGDWGTHDDFSDGHDTAWNTVPVTSPVSKALVRRCTTKVRIDPKGHDTWKFNYWVRLHYTDGSVSEFHYDGHALSEKVRENVFPLS